MEGLPGANELGIEAVTPVQLAAYQAHKLDRASQPMRNHLVLEVDEHGQFQPKPSDRVLAPEYSAGVGLAFDRVKPTLAFEAWLATLAKRKLLGGEVGAGGDLLDGVAIQMLAQPGMAKLNGVGVQVIFLKARLHVSFSESVRTLLGRLRVLGAARQFAGRLIHGRFPQASQAFECLAQASVVDLPRTIQPNQQAPLISRGYNQRQFANEGG